MHVDTYIERILQKSKEEPYGKGWERMPVGKAAVFKFPGNEVISERCSGLVGSKKNFTLA